MNEQTAAPEPRAVLAYGTLRPGWGNYRLVADLVESTEPATVQGFQMFVPRHAWFPYVWRPTDPMPEDLVHGDVLRFSEAAWPEALARMDALEGHPHHYRREVVRLVGGGEAWLYLAADPGGLGRGSILESGDWNDLRDPAGGRAMIR